MPAPFNLLDDVVRIACDVTMSRRHGTAQAAREALARLGGADADLPIDDPRVRAIVRAGATLQEIAAMNPFIFPAANRLWKRAYGQALKARRALKGGA